MGRRDKRGLSAVVETVLLILIVLVAIAAVAGFLIPFVQQRLKATGSCLDAFDKVKLNRDYTCYGAEAWFNGSQLCPGPNDGTCTAGNEIIVPGGDVLVSVETNKIKLDGVILVLSGGGETRSYEIRDKADLIAGMRMYKHRQPFYTGESDYASKFRLPPETGGVTYGISKHVRVLANESNDVWNIQAVHIRPIVNGQQCDVSDSVIFEKCALGI